ncbi:MAG: BREX-1 system phosphatase PglZ type B [bacterium]
MNRTITLIEALRNSLMAAARFNRSDMVAPVAILWTDSDAQWEPLVCQLRSLMPELLILGEYRPEEKTGPAIWLRCVIEGSLPNSALPEEATPVIYMPNVSRQTLRAVEECPDSLKPLVELQYRGAVWTQRNGRDWTVEAFLVSEDGGLGLDVARDRDTKRSMLGALARFAAAPLTRFTGKRLEAEDFDKFMIDDIPRDLLVWINSPGEIQHQWDEKKWGAFVSRCKADYGFDPEKEGVIVAGEKLGLRSDEAWKNLWRRFEESPLLYPGVPELLRKSQPAGVLILNRESWPAENENDEKSLRQYLLSLSLKSAAEARKTVKELEKSHHERRNWVWAQMGLSPLALALEYLAVVAEETSQSIGGNSTEEMAALYLKRGYKVDMAAMLALSSIRSSEDYKAIEAALRSIYLPWLDDTARHFQNLIKENPLPSGCGELPGIEAEEGECLLFADGLRFDVAKRLIAAAEERQLTVGTNWRWAALPTVTATSKPALSPVAKNIKGGHVGNEFRPEIIEEGKPLTIDSFRKLLTSEGYQILSPSDVGEPERAHARAWTEFGELDKLGHTLQGKLAARISEQIELILERIRELFDAGWKRVRVVTDHGWLLMPGVLPSVKLPKYLTECRWARCAVSKDNSKIDFPMATWHWNSHEYFVYGPGINCFSNGNEYAHGGVSLQECLIPDLHVSLNNAPAQAIAKIKEIKWVGIRCRAIIDPGGANIKADLRTKPNDENSSVASPKMVSAEGHVSLLVKNEELEGTVVSLVLLDAAGSVIGKQATTIGGDE